MKIAVDVDGTLTREPESLKKLMSVLMGSKKEVFILTGSLSGSPTQEQRAKQLETFGIDNTHCTSVIMVDGATMEEVAIGKGQFCRDNQIDMIFEDNDLFIQHINKLSPKTSTWLIRRF